MATITSAGTGAWGTGATWAGGTKPGAGDTAIIADGHTVTVNESTAALVKVSPNGANGTGQLAIVLTAADITLAAATIQAYKAAPFISVTGTAKILTVAGNIVGGDATNAACLYVHSACAVNITGNITAGTVATGYGVFTDAASTITITGNVSGTSAAGHVVYNTSTGGITITGNVTGSDTAGKAGVYLAGASATTITGAVTAGAYAAAHGVDNHSTGALLITGNVAGSAGAASYGVLNYTTGTVGVTGNVTGGTVATSYGVYNTSTGIGCIAGNITSGGSTNVIGVLNYSTAKVFINGIIGTTTTPEDAYSGTYYDCSERSAVRKGMFINPIRADMGCCAFSNAATVAVPTSLTFVVSGIGRTESALAVASCPVGNVSNGLVTFTKATSTLLDKLHYTLYGY
jgi:hypothetical protein